MPSPTGIVVAATDQALAVAGDRQCADSWKGRWPADRAGVGTDPPRAICNWNPNRRSIGSMVGTTLNPWWALSGAQNSLPLRYRTGPRRRW
jgi:hypothetical protein